MKYYFTSENHCYYFFRIQFLQYLPAILPAIIGGELKSHHDMNKARNVDLCTQPAKSILVGP